MKITGWFRELLEADPETARIFLSDGKLVQRELAELLGDLAGFYTGPVARAAPEPFTSGDFADHRAEWVAPRREMFAGVEVCEMPPNSRGHLVLEAIRRLEPLDGLFPSDPAWHERLVRALHGASLGGDTIYLCVVDADGMAVSLNQSLFDAFGSGVVIPGTGVLLHNRGAYHTVDTFRGGAKPIHTLSPAMGLREGRPYLVFGTMGGEAQVQIHLQLLARILIAGGSVEDAIAAPRWRFSDAELMYEQGVPALGSLPTGMVASPMPVSELAGHAHAILVAGDGLHAAADPRADGVPRGLDPGPTFA